MNCRDIEQNLLKIVERELSPEEQAVMYAHIVDCAACRDLVALYEPAFAAATVAASESTESLWRAVQTQLNSLDRSQAKAIWWRRPITVTVLQAAAAVVAIWLGVTLGDTPETTVVSDEGSDLIEYYASGFSGANLDLDEIYKIDGNGGGQ